MNTLPIPRSDRIAFHINHLLRLEEERHDQAEIDIDSEEYDQAEKEWFHHYRSWNMLISIFDANCEELIKAFCAPEEQAELIEIGKKISFISVDEPPPSKMKPYTLTIGASAGNATGLRLYVYEADTLKDAINELKDLNLEFSPAKILCANIGCRLDGDENRYETILWTNDGEKWYRDALLNAKYAFYNPETWMQVHEWQDIEEFKVRKN